LDWASIGCNWMDALAEFAPLRTVRFWVDIDSSTSLPYAGQASQRPKMSEGIGVNMLFGEEVGGEGHALPLLECRC
jgi:hypothetical protein